MTGRPPAERACHLVGLLLIAAGLSHLAVAAADPRPWFGPLSWRKPVTFGLSFGGTLIAVTWVASHLRLAARTRALLLGVFAADCVLEVTGITVQAWRHVPSHFNTETPADALIAYSLAAGGAVLVATLGALALLAFRGRVEGPPSRRLALRAGFALLLAGLGSGVAMIVRGVTLSRAQGPATAYAEAGFLKGFHALTLHAVLLLPALAAYLARRPLPEARRTRLVALATAAYVLLCAATLLLSLLQAA
ncbi:hypothetical protein D7294_01120 [Streptomyces hoynatensis]|uniref:Uncharacterized protein n=1 Tax=Streptomyces hoynatensis TaxID=1141874 RepID=A0A3A9ZJ50_9ACTN|nr:hypothetical protein D7294_01120 [Streptomyces hoynatensis]